MTGPSEGYEDETTIWCEVKRHIPSHLYVSLPNLQGMHPYLTGV